MRISDWSSDVCSSDLQQLQSVAPNLMVYQSVGAAIPFLRGIGFSSGDPATESSVAMYVDGVYQPSVYANLFEFNGIERIEVLKGPQGTLFGRNATGGVVQIITKAPSSAPELNLDRKSDVQGKSVSVRVDLGGRRNIKKPNK